MTNGRSFSKISNTTERDAAYHFQSLSADERLETGKSTNWKGNFRCSAPNENRGLPVEVVYNFQSGSISLSTNFSDYFAK